MYNNPKTPLTAQGVVIHETANPNDSAQMEYNYFNSGNRQASAHFFIDSKEIVQCIETNCIAWHAGRTANFKFLGIEMCHATDPKKFVEIWNRAVWLTAILLHSINITTATDDNVMSHAEVSAKWGETDHRDPVSYFRTFGKTMIGFREEVQKIMNEINKPAVEEWKLQIVKDAFTMGIVKDCEEWMKKVEEPMPVWAVLATMINLRKYIDGNCKKI
jgi:N-acetylmuramoyl-L-alanine amidase CwlA